GAHGPHRSDRAPEQGPGAGRGAAGLSGARRQGAGPALFVGPDLDSARRLGGSGSLGDSLFPALELANALRRSAALVPIFWGLFANVHTRGRVRRVAALGHAGHAETYGDPDLLILGHFAAADAYFFLGDPSKARADADRVLMLYSEERHGHLFGIRSHA